MTDRFFEHPILNSPYEYPSQHWELDESGQPTQKTVESRRSSAFISPIPKPKKRRGAAAQQDILFGEDIGISTQNQQYETTSIMHLY